MPDDEVLERFCLWCSCSLCFLLPSAWAFSSFRLVPGTLISASPVSTSSWSFLRLAGWSRRYYHLRVSPSCWFLRSKGMYVRMVSMSWDNFLVDAMEVLSVKTVIQDYWRISSWNAAGSSHRRGPRCCVQTSSTALELLLPPWFSCEGVVRQCRVVRGTTTSGKPSGAPAYFLRVRLSMAGTLAVDISLTNCCWHQTSPTPRKCCSCQLSLSKKPSGSTIFLSRATFASARMCTPILYRQTARTVSKRFSS